MSVSTRSDALRRAPAPEFDGAIVVPAIHVHYLSGRIPPDRAPSY